MDWFIGVLIFAGGIFTGGAISWLEAYFKEKKLQQELKDKNADKISLKEGDL